MSCSILQPTVAPERALVLSSLACPDRLRDTDSEAAEYTLPCPED